MAELDILLHLIRLEEAVGGIAPTKHYHTSFGHSLTYDDLQRIAGEMACFMNLPFFVFRIHSKEQSSGVAGHVKLSGDRQQVVNVEIQPRLLGYPSAAVKVLAHELSHKYLEFHRIALPDDKRNEVLTDVTSIYLGFGEYVVDGSTYTQHDVFAKTRTTSTIGYLTPEECAFTYDVVCRMRGDSDAEIEGNLTEKSLLQKARRQFDFNYHADHVRERVEWISKMRRWLERVDLDVCNVEKVGELYAPACIGASEQLRDLKDRCLKYKKRLEEIELFLSRASEKIRPLVAYAADYDDANGLNGYLDIFCEDLVENASELNKRVSSRVPDNVDRSSWNERKSQIVTCPSCGSGLRLPGGLVHVGVVCPKCKYAFDYSTTCPDCKWDPVAKKEPPRQAPPPPEYWQRTAHETPSAYTPPSALTRAVRGVFERLWGFLDRWSWAVPVTIAVVIVVAGIYWRSDFHREREDWSALEGKQDSIEDLRRYLKRWPEGRHAGKAKEQLQRIRLAERGRLDLKSVESVSYYLARFPEEDAVALRAEQYEVISKAPTFALCRDFSKVLAGNEGYYSDVTNTLMGLVRRGWLKAQQQDTESSYNAFISEFNGMTEYTDKAFARINEFYSDYDFVCKKGDIDSFERYLRLHPRGRKADDIKKRLVLKKIENVRNSEHAVINAPGMDKATKGELPLCLYSVTNRLPYKVEVLVGNANYARSIELDGMEGEVILMPTGTYERCVIVDSHARPAYSKSEFLGGVYGEGFHIVTRFGHHGRDGDWADSTIEGAGDCLEDMIKKRREMDDLRERYGWPADLALPPFPCQK